MRIGAARVGAYKFSQSHPGGAGKVRVEEVLDMMDSKKENHAVQGNANQAKPLEAPEFIPERFTSTNLPKLQKLFR